MSKRLSVISIVIYAIAVVAGALFVPVQSAVYEFENGPDILTSELFDRLESSTGRVVFLPGKDMPKVLLKCKRDTNLIEFVTEVADHVFVKTMISKLDDGRFELDSGSMTYKGATLKDSVDVFFRIDASYHVLNARQANKRIDKIHFPNKSTRKGKKQEILKLVDEFNKS